MAEHEAPAPVVPAEPPPAAEEPDVCFEPEAVLDFVREEAARRDRVHKHIYQTATSRRVKNAGWLAHDLMRTHAELHRRVGRGARTGRRKHAQEVYRLLNASNDADLVLVQVLLAAAIATLPPDAPRRDD